MRGSMLASPRTPPRRATSPSSRNPARSPPRSSNGPCAAASACRPSSPSATRPMSISPIASIISPPTGRPAPSCSMSSRSAERRNSCRPRGPPPASSRSSSSNRAAMNRERARRPRIPAPLPEPTRSTMRLSGAPVCCAFSTSTNCLPLPRRSAGKSPSPASAWRSSPTAAASACSPSTGSSISVARSPRLSKATLAAARPRPAADLVARQPGRHHRRCRSRPLRGALAALLADPDNDAVLALNVPTALASAAAAAVAVVATVGKSGERRASQAGLRGLAGGGRAGGARLRGGAHPAFRHRGGSRARVHASRPLPRGAGRSHGDPRQPADRFRARHGRPPGRSSPPPLPTAGSGSIPCR